MVPSLQPHVRRNVSCPPHIFCLEGPRQIYPHPKPQPHTYIPLPYTNAQQAPHPWCKALWLMTAVPRSSDCDLLVPPPTPHPHTRPRTVRIGSERHLVCIEDPFETSHDLGRTVDKGTVERLRDEFRLAWRIFREAPDVALKLFEPAPEKDEGKGQVLLLDGGGLEGGDREAVGGAGGQRRSSSGGGGGGGNLGVGEAAGGGQRRGGGGGGGIAGVGGTPRAEGGWGSGGRGAPAPRGLQTGGARGVRW